MTVTYYNMTADAAARHTGSSGLSAVPCAHPSAAQPCASQRARPGRGLLSAAREPRRMQTRPRLLVILTRTLAVAWAVCERWAGWMGRTCDARKEMPVACPGRQVGAGRAHDVEGKWLGRTRMFRAGRHAWHWQIYALVAGGAPPPGSGALQVTVPTLVL